jgi:hypothetical protein
MAYRAYVQSVLGLGFTLLIHYSNQSSQTLLRALR